MAIAPYLASDRFHSLVDELTGFNWGGQLGRTDLLRPTHADIQETADEIRVMVEVPGMRAEDIEISLENNTLTVSGEKVQPSEEKNGNVRWHLSERRYGRFSRSFVLPRHVDHDRIEAHMEDGVLAVTIPKSENAKPRRIEIESGGKRKRILGRS